MTTYASVYINGEVLCYTSYDGYPFNLGEILEGVNFNWRSVLLTCKEYGICTVNINYFNKDPEFVYNCLGKYAKRDFINIVPNGLTPSAIEILRKGDPHEKFEDIIRNFPNELYEAPEHMLSNIQYHYNLVNNQVIVRYPIKNFPWIPVEEALEIEGGELEEISNDMYGFLGDEDSDYRYKTYRKVEENGPISSGRHLLKGCKKATELLPQDPNNWWNYGVSLELAGKLNQAFESYKQATRLTPNNPKIWQILGSAYLRNNYKEEAHKSFENAISNIKNLDYSIMDYYEKEKFKNNTTNLYETLLKADFADLIKEFNENIHSKISLKEIEFLTSVQEKTGKPFLNYESERGKIIKLSLGYLKLETISDSLGDLTSLKELNLKKNNLKSLPESIGLLTLLEKLDLSMNWLTNLPEGIGKLSSLKKLNLKENKLKTHPAWLTKLPLLEHLEIDPVIPEIDPKEKEVVELIEKEIEKPLPIVLEIKERELGYIVKNKHITGLSLYNCKLTSIPDWIGNLVSLEELGLHNNELINLPESIGLLTSLKILDLGSNKLSSLPKSIA
ncbi:MAG: leucine-rich repeat domain-containing protein, partial [Promethearchaeota archaeon]